MVAFHIGDALDFLQRIFFAVVFPHHREHVCVHGRRGHQYPRLFAFEIREIDREYAVDFPFFQRFQRGFRGGERHRGKDQICVFHAGGSDFQIILQGSRQRSRVVVLCAVGEIIGPVSHTDDAVARKPVDLGRREIGAVGVDVEIFFIHLLTVVSVFILYPVHGGVKFPQQVGTVFAHCEEERGGPHAANGDGSVVAFLFLDDVRSHIHIQLTAAQHGQRILLAARQIHDFRLNAVLCRPDGKSILLYAALVYAHPFSVEGGVVVQADSRIAARNIDIIFLFPHWQGGIQHVRRPFFFIGNIAQKVDFAPLQHLQELRPARTHIFVFPAGISGDLLLVFIGKTGTPAKGIRYIEGRLKPAYPHGLFFLHVGKRDRGQKDCQQEQQAQPNETLFYSVCRGRIIRHDVSPAVLL